MRRVSVLLVVAAATLALATSIEAPSAVAVERSTASAAFSLLTGDGFRVKMEAQNDEVALTVLRRRQFAIYRVKGQISPTGEIEARFGGLGRISVAFEREGSDLHPCREELVGADGFFVGTIDFRGERNYLGLNADRARGSLSPLEGTAECQPEAGESPPEAPKVIPGSGGSTPDSGSGGRGETEEPGTAYLTASASDGRAVFIAVEGHGSPGRSGAFFFGGKVERRGRMRIIRGASASVRNARAFAYDDGLSSAMVRPPKPFHGKASFRKEPGGATSWTGSLSVPVLGGDPLSLTGRDMVAKLVRKVPSD